MPASSGSGGIVKVITKTVTKIPESLQGSVDTLASLASFVSEKGGFQNAVIFVIASWLISGILKLAETVVGITLLPFNISLSAISKALDDLGGAGGSAGGAVIGAIENATTAVETAAAGAGVLAPVVVVLFWTLLFVAAFAVLDWLVRYFLGVSFRSVIP